MNCWRIPSKNLRICISEDSLNNIGFRFFKIQEGYFRPKCKFFRGYKVTRTTWQFDGTRKHTERTHKRKGERLFVFVELFSYIFYRPVICFHCCRAHRVNRWNIIQNKAGEYWNDWHGYKVIVNENYFELTIRIVLSVILIPLSDEQNITDNYSCYGF